MSGLRPIATKNRPLVTILTDLSQGMRENDANETHCGHGLCVAANMQPRRLINWGAFGL
jgi:hypothetical protein